MAKKERGKKNTGLYKHLICNYYLLLTVATTKNKSPEIKKFPAIFIFKIRYMRQGFFLFIRIQIFYIPATAIRTKNLSLAAGAITGCIKLGSRPAPAAILAFFLLITHWYHLINSNTQDIFIIDRFDPGMKSACFYYIQFQT